MSDESGHAVTGMSEDRLKQLDWIQAEDLDDDLFAIDESSPERAPFGWRPKRVPQPRFKHPVCPENHPPALLRIA
jgi:hypothetical protein